MSKYDTPPQDVYGIETEYSCMLTLPGDIQHEIVGSCHSADIALDLYQQPKKKGSDEIPAEVLTSALETAGIYRNSCDMLSNGGRLYIDPSGPEYATPETTTAEEAAQRSFDGDEILLNAFRYLREQNIITGYQVNRRVVDHNRTSRGIHLNTVTAALSSNPGANIIGNLATLNVAKGAIFGSGGLLLDQKGQTAYYHSPRLAITTDLSEHWQDYRKRPLVRLPFKADGTLKRIETVSSDALNFAWPLRASMVVTNAFVRLLEAGGGGALPLLRKPVRSAHIVGRHGHANQLGVVDRHDANRGMYPLDLMRGICEAILTADNMRMQLDAEARQVIPEIIGVADRMSADPFSVATHVESVARLAAMQRKMEKGSLALDSETMCRFDYAWDWLGGGLAETLRKDKGVGWHGFSSEYSRWEQKRRLITPPQDTRARVRGEAIRSAQGLDQSNWTNIDRGDGDSDTAPYYRPFETEPR